MCDVAKGGKDDVGGRVGQHLDLGGKPCEGIADADCSCFVDPYAEASIGFKGGSNIPSINSMWGPGLAGGRFFMGKYTTTRRAKGRTVVVKAAVHLCIGRKFGVQAGWAHQVQGDLSLGEQFIP